MLSKPAGVAVLVAGFMAAAAGGAYIAMRQQPQPVAPATASVDPAPALLPAPTMQTQAQAQPGQPKDIPMSAGQPSVGVETRTITPVPSAPVKKRQPARAPVVREQRTNSPAASTESTTANEPAPVSAMPVDEAAQAAPVEAPAPQARLQEITIPSDTVIGVQVDSTVSSERARVEDRVDGRVTRDVSVGGRVAIPAGTKMIGSVTLVERGGKFKDRSRIAVRFHTAQLADGSRIALQTTAIMREGDSPSRETAAKVGGAAVGGAILGAILGGGKGAAIGGTAGAAGGTAVVMAGDRNAATLPSGTTVTVRLMSDVAVTVER